MAPVLACAIGALLGLRLNVQVLIPVSVATVMVHIAGNILTAHSLFFDFSGMVILIVAIQAGYFVGLTGREVCAGLLHRLTRDQTKRV